MPVALYYVLGGSALLGTTGYALSESTKSLMRLSVVAGVAYFLVKKGV